MLSAEQGLRRLIEGNKRFVGGQARFSTVCKDTLPALARGQQPYATILGCSDSRVPPELIFDANFGELFIVRVAGNVISPEVMGSLQYVNLPTWPARDLDAWLPDNWKQAHAARCAALEIEAPPTT